VPRECQGASRPFLIQGAFLAQGATKKGASGMGDVEGETKSIRNYSVIDVIAIFSALAIILGFVFFNGFSYQLNWHLLQFMTPTDFVSAASYYVFGALIAGFLFFRTSYSDYDPDQFVMKPLASWLRTDYPLLSPEGAKAHRSATKFARFLAFFPVASVVFFFSVNLFLHWKLSFQAYIFWFVLSGLPYAMFSWIHMMTLERKAALRRSIGVKGIVINSIIIVLAYGLFEGWNVATADVKNVVVYLTDNTKQQGIFVYRFSTGVATKQPGSATITFLPDDKIAKLELLN
jgi:hypothetical protein